MLHRFDQHRVSVRLVLPSLILLLWSALAPVTATADVAISGAKEGPAIDGYDPVAYFTQGKPQRGSPAFTHTWRGAEWRFASAEHRDLFAATPERYAPQYGGYCAYAMTRGSLAAGDGDRWKIVDDKLYLNTNWFALQLWQDDIPTHIREADQEWPQVEDKLRTSAP